MLALWALAYLVGMRWGVPNADRSRRLARWARLVMIGLVLLAGSLCVASGTAGAPVFAWLVLGGLVCGAAGDLILADMIPLRHARLAAMGIFGLGHILYVAGTLSLWGRLASTPGLSAVWGTAGALAAVLAWGIVVRSPAAGRALNAGSLVYSMLLGAAAGTALGLTVTTGSMVMLSAGLILFLASDLMLAQYLIRGRGFPYIRDVVWIIYSAGQMLIALSICAAQFIPPRVG
jgi:hypothetical protein